MNVLQSIGFAEKSFTIKCEVIYTNFHSTSSSNFGPFLIFDVTDIRISQYKKFIDFLKCESNRNRSIKDMFTRTTRFFYWTQGILF